MTLSRKGQFITLSVLLSFLTVNEKEKMWREMEMKLREGWTNAVPMARYGQHGESKGFSQNKNELQFANVFHLCPVR